MSKPIVALTMGDAAGIGPEIIAKTLSFDSQVYGYCHPLVIGDKSIMVRAMKIIDSSQTLRSYELNSVLKTHCASIPFDPQYLDIIDLNLLPKELVFGRISAAAGDAAFHYVATAVQLALAGEVQAICTAPLNKEALHLGGHNFPGHTEILASLMGVKNFAMMLTAPKLRVIHVTTHVGLVDAVAKITPERVYNVIQLSQNFLKRLGLEHPRIAVAGINPHAGENGLFGHGEEETKVLPALKLAQSEGIDAVGPLPPDTVFSQALRGDYDLVVAMYHDQGHIPIKVVGFDTGVNITVGLPVIRTSVDHGTAFDIAGKGLADPSSLKEALRQAAILTV